MKSIPNLPPAVLRYKANQGSSSMRVSGVGRHRSGGSPTIRVSAQRPPRAGNRPGATRSVRESARAEGSGA